VSGEQRAQLLGPVDSATGAPVKVGIISDGVTAAFDASDELRAAKATAEFWNERRGGIGGRPIQVLTCETGGDPSGATDCGNQMIQDGAVAVVVNNSSVVDTAWEPLHAAGVPTLIFQDYGDKMTTDAKTSFLLINPIPTLFGLPISVARNEHADKVAFVLIDVPAALSAFQAQGPAIMKNAGLDYDLVRVPPGTPDMTSQMQQVASSGADVVDVVGNDAFCISAIQGLKAAGYTGKITAVSQCITDATRDALPDQLDGVYIQSSLALGAGDDPSYQLYEAVMGAYGKDVRDTENINAMGAYTVLAALATGLEGIKGDVTPRSVITTLKAMPEADLPGGGGVKFRCGGSASPSLPAICSNQWLRATLDAKGQPSHYDVEDSSTILEGL
jgi:branched-chain amino acid transport system substrate-binding protein